MHPISISYLLSPSGMSSISYKKYKITFTFFQYCINCISPICTLVAPTTYLFLVLLLPHLCHPPPLSRAIFVQAVIGGDALVVGDVAEITGASHENQGNNTHFFFLLIKHH